MGRIGLYMLWDGIVGVGVGFGRREKGKGRKGDGMISSTFYAVGFFGVVTFV